MVLQSKSDMGNQENNQEGNLDMQGWKPSPVKNQDNWVSLVWGREELETQESNPSILREFNSGKVKWAYLRRISYFRSFLQNN